METENTNNQPTPELVNKDKSKDKSSKLELKWLVKIFKNRFTVGVIIIVAVLLVWVIFFNSIPRPDKDKLQAVFLTNGQVYFGELDVVSKEYVKLTGIYYLQVQQPVQPQQPGGSPNFNLIKLGGELHGPEDEMFIPSERILFWENLRADSQVTQLINQTQ